MEGINLSEIEGLLDDVDVESVSVVNKKPSFSENLADSSSTMTIPRNYIRRAVNNNNIPKYGNVQTIGSIRRKFESQMLEKWNPILKSDHSLIERCEMSRFSHRKFQRDLKEIFDNRHPIPKENWKTLLKLLKHNRHTYIMVDGKKHCLSGSLNKFPRDIIYGSFHKKTVKKKSKTPVKGEQLKPVVDPKLIRKRGLLSTMSHNFKPGPLSKKPKLNNLKYNSADDVRLLPLPSVGLEVYPRVGCKLDPAACIRLQSVRNQSGLVDEKWANFAASVLECENDNGVPFVFQLPYENNQNRILFRNDPDFKHRQCFTTSSKINESKELANLEAHLEYLDNYVPKDDVQSTIKNVLHNMLTSVSINLIQDTFGSMDSEYAPVESNKLISNSNVESYRSLKRNRELSRLDVTVIDVSDEKKPGIKCTRECCRLGCVCSSLECNYMLNNHCGRIACMLNTCTCQFGKPDECINEDGISKTVVANLQHQLNRYLAKEEKKFRRTVIKTKDDTIVIGASRRGNRLPKKYDDFIITKDKINENLKTMCTVQIHLNRLPTELVIEPFCMVHNLYRCFCKGRIMNGSSITLSNSSPALTTAHDGDVSLQSNPIPKTPDKPKIHLDNVDKQSADVIDNISKLKNNSRAERLMRRTSREDKKLVESIPPLNNSVVTEAKNQITKKLRIVSSKNKPSVNDDKKFNKSYNTDTDNSESQMLSSYDPLLQVRRVVSTSLKTSRSSKRIVKRKKQVENALKSSETQCMLDVEAPNKSVDNSGNDINNVLPHSNVPEQEEPQVDIHTNKIPLEDNTSRSNRTNERSNIISIRVPLKSQNQIISEAVTLFRNQKLSMKLPPLIFQKIIVYSWAQLVKDFQTNAIFLWVSSNEPYKVFATLKGTIRSKDECIPIIYGKPLKKQIVCNHKSLKYILCCDLEAFNSVAFIGRRYAWELLCSFTKNITPSRKDSLLNSKVKSPTEEREYKDSMSQESYHSVYLEHLKEIHSESKCNDVEPKFCLTQNLQQNIPNNDEPSDPKVEESMLEPTPSLQIDVPSEPKVEESMLEPTPSLQIDEPSEPKVEESMLEPTPSLQIDEPSEPKVEESMLEPTPSLQIDELSEPKVEESMLEPTPSLGSKESDMSDKDLSENDAKQMSEISNKDLSDAPIDTIEQSSTNATANDNEYQITTNLMESDQLEAGEITRNSIVNEPLVVKNVLYGLFSNSLLCNVNKAIKYHWLSLNIGGVFDILFITCKYIPCKMFTMHFSDILEAMTRANISGKTCRYPISSINNLNNVPEFGAYAIPGNDLKQIFLGPCIVGEKLVLTVLPKPTNKNIIWGVWTKQLSDPRIIVWNKSSNGEKNKDCVIFVGKPFQSYRLTPDMMRGNNFFKVLSNPADENNIKISNISSQSQHNIPTPTQSDSDVSNANDIDESKQNVVGNSNQSIEETPEHSDKEIVEQSDTDISNANDIDESKQNDVGNSNQSIKEIPEHSDKEILEQSDAEMPSDSAASESHEFDDENNDDVIFIPTHTEVIELSDVDDDD